MIYKSALVTEASGSLGGLVASHNKGGQYLRARVVPVNPGTPQQEFIRATMADLANRWSNTLSDAQRDQWTAYAEAVPIPSALGDPHNIPPLAMYVRSNVTRLQAGLARIDTGPAILNLGSFTVPTIDALSAGASTADIGFDNTDAWAGEVGGAMFVYASRGNSPTINFFKGPYRFAGLIVGAVVPPTSPATITLPFAVVATQRVFFRFSTARADGRLASDFRDFGTAAA